MPVSVLTRRVAPGVAALRQAVSPSGWRGAFDIDVRKAGFAVPLRVGAAVTLVFVIGGLAGQHTLAGFAALGALVSAFCRPDPYPVRAGRLVLLGTGITLSIGVGGALGIAGSGAVVEALVISVLAGVAAYLVWALHIVGPGAVIFVFGAAGAQAFARDLGGLGMAMAATAAGAVIGVLAALAPWLIQLVRRRLSGSGGQSGPATARRETILVTVKRAPHRALLVRAARITVAGCLGAAIAIGLGLGHPMWATMGAVATMQGVGYHVTVHRGVQRLLGNIGGAALAAILLALPLGYWGAVVAIIVFQTIAEIACTVNYALTSMVVTPMALLLTALGAGLAPAAALDRVLDTAVGVVVGIVVAAVTISGADAKSFTKPAASLQVP